MKHKGHKFHRLPGSGGPHETRWAQTIRGGAATVNLAVQLLNCTGRIVRRFYDSVTSDALIEGVACSALNKIPHLLGSIVAECRTVHRAIIISKFFASP